MTRASRCMALLTVSQKLTVEVDFTAVLYIKKYMHNSHTPEISRSGLAQHFATYFPTYKIREIGFGRSLNVLHTKRVAVFVAPCFHP